MKGDMSVEPQFSEALPGGRFHVRRDLRGLVRIECPPVMLVPPDVAVAMASAIVRMAGGEVIITDPGQTVIRPPRNGNGKVLR